MDHAQLHHYHICWSDRATLDWERFRTHEDAAARAKQLAHPSESYTIEEYDRTCPRCRDAMNLKSKHSTYKGTSA
jgi:hypothetical protein